MKLLTENFYTKSIIARNLNHLVVDSTLPHDAFEKPGVQAKVIQISE